MKTTSSTIRMVSGLVALREDHQGTGRRHPHSSRTTNDAARNAQKQPVSDGK